MICSICKNKDSKLKIKDYPGYIENSYFDIYYCDKCDTSFIDTKNINLSIYNTIYKMLDNNPDSVRAYDRYLNYSKKIKEYKNPFLFLINSENTYYPIYEFIKNKKNLRILEIGCGYGYLTYALKTLGHLTTGIDISKEAINFANENFGDNYYSGDLLNEDFFNKNEFDLIIATELIEHLTDAPLFIELCKKLLKPKGQLIITTPSKDWGSCVTDSYWFTDNPPVHTLWLSKKSLTTLGNLHNLETSFLPTLNKNYSKNFFIVVFIR